MDGQWIYDRKYTCRSCRRNTPRKVAPQRITTDPVHGQYQKNLDIIAVRKAEPVLERVGKSQHIQNVTRLRVAPEGHKIAPGGEGVDVGFGERLQRPEVPVIAPQPPAQLPRTHHRFVAVLHHGPGDQEGRGHPQHGREQKAQNFAEATIHQGALSGPSSAVSFSGGSRRQSRMSPWLRLSGPSATRRISTLCCRRSCG